MALDYDKLTVEFDEFIDSIDKSDYDKWLEDKEKSERIVKSMEWVMDLMKRTWKVGVDDTSILSGSCKTSVSKKTTSTKYKIAA